MAELVIRMAGEPTPQNQGKIGRWKAKDGREGSTIRQPTKVKHYKLDLRELMYRAAVEAGWMDPGGHAGFSTFFGSQPLALSIEAVFSCPTSQYRKREPLPRRPHVGRYGNCDNLTKPVGDAGESVLWDDDGQIAELHVRKWIGAQGEAPYIEIRVRPLAETSSQGGDRHEGTLNPTGDSPQPVTGVPEATPASGAPLQPQLFSGDNENG